MHVWVGLCTQMLEVIDILNGPSAGGSMNRTTLLRLWDLDTTLRAFFSKLPAYLTVDDAVIEELDATAYGLQMQLTGIQITLHLAMIKSEHIARGVHTGDPKQRYRATDQLYAIVAENVLRICRLALSFRRIFGVENIITVMLDNMFVAAIALISLILRNQQQGKSVEKDIRWLRMLFDTLEAVGKHYPVTARMRASLTRIMAKTPLAPLFPTSTVRTPESALDSMTGIIQNETNVMEEIGGADMSAFDLGSADPSFNRLDFTLTDEDNTWIHESGWNIASWSMDTVDDSALLR